MGLFHRSRPLHPGEGQSGTPGKSHQRPGESTVIVAGPGHFVELVPPGSPAFHDIQVLQGQRFARASAPRKKTAYLETVSVDPQHTLALAVRRATGLLVGATLVELPTATNIEFMVQFQPGSPSVALLAAGTFAEIRGLALHTGLEWQETLDILDVLGNALVQIAGQRNIAWLWTLPRQPAMSLLLADISGLLPPFRFTLNTDVLGWWEGSEQLQNMRRLRMKSLPIAPETLPVIYQITPATLAEDLAGRRALWEQRHHTPDLAMRFQAAMLHASRQVHIQIAWLNSQNNPVGTNHSNEQVHDMKQDTSKAPPAAETSPRPLPTPAEAARTSAVEKTSEGDKKGFLPGADAAQKATYLRQFVEQAGSAAKRYKAISYELLSLEPGMQVLDVGCGVGLDLLPLAEMVGPKGLVIGVDKEAALVQKAIEASVGHANVRATLGTAEALPFSHRSFDGVRADRVLQHVQQPGVVLEEMWRVLKPGGVVTLVEPDWQMTALYPGSTAGGDDAHIWDVVVSTQQREITHPLLGRQLLSLLKQPGDGLWEQVEVRVEAFVLTSWAGANAVLRLTEMAQRVVQEQPTLAEEVTAWLKAMEAAAEHGTFLASMQLFYARAMRAEIGTEQQKQPTK